MLKYLVIISAMYLMLFLSTFIHELGHYLLFRRWRKLGTELELRIGTYPKEPNFTCSFGGTTLAISLLMPLGGFCRGTLSDEPTAQYHRRMLVVTLGGALASLVVAVIGFYIASHFIEAKQVKYVWRAMFHGSATWTEIAIGLLAWWNCLVLGDVVGACLIFPGMPTDISVIIDYFKKRGSFASL